MPGTSIEPTTAVNLESKFDAGEDVLDYFDLRRARVMPPVAAPAKFGHVSAEAPIPSVAQLKRAVSIAEQIQQLENELRSILGKRDAQPERSIVRKTQREIVLYGAATRTARYKGQKAGANVHAKAGLALS